VATVDSDQWQGYKSLPAIGRGHSATFHAEGKWAWNDDRSGVREVYRRTLERIWTRPANFLQPFRGVKKKYQHQYVAVGDVRAGYNFKRAVMELLRVPRGLKSTARPS